MGHGGGGAGAGDGDAGYCAAEAGGFDDGAAFGEGDCEASVEGVSCAGGFDYGAGVDGGDVLDGGGVFDECTLGSEGDDGVADSADE